MNGDALIYFVRYLAEIILTGGYLNKWLDKIPTNVQSALLDVGTALASWLGY